MNKECFLKKFQDVLQTDAELTEDTVLDTIEEWDSLSKISTIAFIDREFALKINMDDVNEFVTIADIINKVEV